MSGFTADWLALRELADHASRSTALTAFVTTALESRSALRILDLGTGSGSNVRYLAPRLRQPQQWRVVDNDARLLDRARHAASAVQGVASDLAALDPIWFDDVDLVTASALFDLVSETWLTRFAERCRRGPAAVLAVLNYDGRIVCDPADEDDAAVAALVNRHQRTDKGLGPALGPDAGRRLEAVLAEDGWAVRRATSDWVLGQPDPALQRQLLRGWASAALELEPGWSARIRAWEERRLAHVDHGRSQIVVGHDDVAAVIR
jgi:SAM-dependent methyltransferase